MIFKPHRYQEDAISFAVQNKRCGIFADPGLGKTAIALSVIDELMLDPNFKGALIVSPLRVMQNTWPAETAKWESLSHLQYNSLRDMRKYEYLFTRPRPINHINVENMLWLFDAIYHWNSWPFNFLIIDESSKFKDQGGKRFKLIKKVLDRFDRVIIMTGTPAAEGLEGLWSQIYMLDKGAALGKNITSYRRKYFVPGGYKNKEWSLRPGADDEISAAISHLVMRIDAKDHLDMPDLSKIVIKVHMDDRPKKIYKDFEKQLWADIDGDRKLLSTRTSSYAACRQVANGFLYEPPGMLQAKVKPLSRGVNLVHEHKIEACKDLVDELMGKPALIAYHYEQDLSALKRAFGADTRHIGSGVSGAYLNKIVEDWNSGKIRVLLGHPGSMAHGLNMQGAGAAVIFFSLPDSLENYMQFIARVWRQGAEATVKVYHLVTVGTVDVLTMRRLGQKGGTQNKLLDDIKKYRKNKKI